MPIMLQCKEDTPSIFNGASRDACLSRVQLIVNVMKAHVQRVRLAEGFLSAAQLNGGADLEEHTFNYVRVSNAARIDL